MLMGIGSPGGLLLLQYIYMLFLVVVLLVETNRHRQLVRSLYSKTKLEQASLESVGGGFSGGILVLWDSCPATPIEVVKGLFSASISFRSSDS